MYNPNQMNSLYFYPHRLHFTPIPDAADSEQRNRWFPSYKASTAGLPGRTPIAKATRVRQRDLRNSDKFRQEVDDARMDDDGAPMQAASWKVPTGDRRPLNR